MSVHERRATNDKRFLYKSIASIWKKDSTILPVKKGSPGESGQGGGGDEEVASQVSKWLSQLQKTSHQVRRIKTRVSAEAADKCVYRQNNATTPSNAQTSNADLGTPSRLVREPETLIPFTHWDLELMHHFCISTSQAIEDESVVSAWMRDVAPTLLLPHANLVGGLLGLTAAHMAYLRPYDKSQYVSLAYQHLNHALVQSQQSLQNLNSAQLTPEYAGALCLTAICTSMTIQALPVIDSNQSHMTPIQRFITNFRAFRGISVVFWACSIHGRGFDQSFLPPSGQSNPFLCDEESLRILDDVYIIIRTHGERSESQQDQRQHSMYCAVFDELRNYIRAKTIRQISTVITGSTPAQWNMFCKLLEGGDVICSLIGLCYSVSYATFDSRWYMGGLQSKVAIILAARVEHAGPMEAKIAAWARRRIGRFDAVPDQAPPVSAAGNGAYAVSTHARNADRSMVNSLESISSYANPATSEDTARMAAWAQSAPGEQAIMRGAFELPGFLPSQR